MNEQEMIFYTNKMPHDCRQCPCYQHDKEQPCGLSKCGLHYRYDGDGQPDKAVNFNCPLKNLSDHDLEVTREAINLVPYLTPSTKAEKTEVQHV